MDLLHGGSLTLAGLTPTCCSVSTGGISLLTTQGTLRVGMGGYGLQRLRQDCNLALHIHLNSCLPTLWVQAAAMPGIPNKLSIAGWD